MGAPHVRTTGVKISLEVMYTNRHEMIKDGEVQTVCVIKVNAAPAWNSRTSSDYTILTDGALGSTESRLRYRYAYGVSFAFKTGGSFEVIDPYALMTAVVNVVVMLTLPTAVARIIALYFIGAVSKIYRNILRAEFSITQAFHGLAARMMAASFVFRGLTKQWDLSVDQMKDLTKEDVERSLAEAFCCDDKMTEAEKKKHDEEVRLLTSVVYHGIDEDGSGAIQHNEYVKAFSSEEPMQAASMSKFFDTNR